MLRAFNDIHAWLLLLVPVYLLLQTDIPLIIIPDNIISDRSFRHTGPI